MPLEIPAPEITRLVADLNRHFDGKSARSVLEFALDDPRIGPLAMVSSFGADSAVLLHMASRINPALPVLFLDTELLFPQTLSYQRQLASHLGLSNVTTHRPGRETLFSDDHDAMLHQRDPDACCTLRKTRPLKTALTGYDAWITGRRRSQGELRQTLEFFEQSDGRTKINPLINWNAARIQDYFDTHNLPRHPLVAGGFASIGCQPCTTRVAPGEDPRAGRWRGRQKSECGIHFPAMPAPPPKQGTAP